MRNSLGSRLLRPAHVFWAAVIILAAVSSVAVFATSRLLDHYSASENSEEAVSELRTILADLKDMESGARGYAITRDPRFLELYRSGRANAGESLGRFGAVASATPSLAAQLSDLEKAARQRTSLADRVVTLAGRNGAEREVIAVTLAGKQAMDRVARSAASLIASEQAIYRARRDAFEWQSALATTALGMGVAASLLMLIWLFSQRNREIVRRRRVENELRALNAELEERVQSRAAEVEDSRRLLDAIIENMPDTVFLKEAHNEFRYLMINKAGETLLSMDRKDFIGCNASEVFPPDEAAISDEEDRRVLEAPDRKILVERTITTPQGRRFVALCKLVLPMDDRGQRFILGLVRDITDQKGLETQVREMQRLDSVGRLTGGIAHDFNNLLAIIMGSVELVRDQLVEGSETAGIADEALDAVRRGADLVRRLLAFARKQHLDPVAVDLNDRLPSVTPLLQRTLGERVRITVNPGNELWKARIDPTQVDDALVNLAINARDAMPDGGSLTIETANVVLDEDYASHHVEVVPGDYVMLAVSDTGTGMTPPVMERAFEPFFTTKEEGRGTGLGLSQVFGWVKQSGGHIKLYSELDHGTTIKLYLPRAVDENGRAAEPVQQEEHDRGHETILVVEDNPNVRRTVKRQLIDLGYVPVEAEDAETALERIRDGLAFDMLLTDVVMPGGMSGYELAAELERLRPGAKVLFTSGYTELAATGIQTSRKGPLISKPYSKRDLGRALRTILDGPSEGDG